MDYQKIIDQYYPSENELRQILLTHSRQVADRCLTIAREHPELCLDTVFLEEAAMLHDIGIYRCDAPGIRCFGTEPYICHGIIGGRLLRERGLVRHAQVCERHTGTGISHEQIQIRHLPLPLNGQYEPDTLEEQIVCYADKFYSKTRLGLTRTVEQTARSLEPFGEASLRRFFHWVDMFE